MGLRENWILLFWAIGDFGRVFCQLSPINTFHGSTGPIRSNGGTGSSGILPGPGSVEAAALHQHPTQVSRIRSPQALVSSSLLGANSLPNFFVSSSIGAGVNIPGSIHTSTPMLGVNQPNFIASSRVLVPLQGQRAPPPGSFVNHNNNGVGLFGPSIVNLPGSRIGTGRVLGDPRRIRSRTARITSLVQTPRIPRVSISLSAADLLRLLGIGGNAGGRLGTVSGRGLGHLQSNSGLQIGNNLDSGQLLGSGQQIDNGQILLTSQAPLLDLLGIRTIGQQKSTANAPTSNNGNVNGLFVIGQSQNGELIINRGGGNALGRGFDINNIQGPSLKNGGSGRASIGVQSGTGAWQTGLPAGTSAHTEKDVEQEVEERPTTNNGIHIIGPGGNRVFLNKNLAGGGVVIGGGTSGGTNIVIGHGGGGHGNNGVQILPSVPANINKGGNRKPVVINSGTGSTSAGGGSISAGGASGNKPFTISGGTTGQTIMLGMGGKQGSRLQVTEGSSGASVVQMPNNATFIINPGGSRVPP